MTRNTHLLIYLIPLLLLVGLLFLAREKNHPQTQPLHPPAVNLTGQPLPLFQVDNLWQPNKLFTQKDLQGHVSVLNVWASWCPACRHEHMALMNITRNYRIPIYGLNYKDNPETARTWLEQVGNPYVATGMDLTGGVAMAFGIYGTPETFLIDKRGMIRYSYIGALDETTWEQILWPMIKQYEAE